MNVLLVNELSGTILTNMFVKLGESSRLELAMFVVNHDILKSQTSSVVEHLSQNP